MTLEEFHKQQSKRRGRRWFFIICAVCLVVMALCLAACSPSLLRIEAPQGMRRAAAAGKIPTTLSPDEYWSDWLNSRTATRLTP